MSGLSSYRGAAECLDEEMTECYEKHPEKSP